MERTYAPLIRQFSSIKGYQAAYTLVYALDASEGGCHLTLDRKGEREQQVSEFVPLHPEAGYRLLQYLCENAVQPEIWGDVIADRLPALEAGASDNGALLFQIKLPDAEFPVVIAHQSDAQVLRIPLTGHLRHLRSALLPAPGAGPAGAAAGAVL